MKTIIIISILIFFLSWQVGAVQYIFQDLNVSGKVNATQFIGAVNCSNITGAVSNLCTLTAGSGSDGNNYTMDCSVSGNLTKTATCSRQGMANFTFSWADNSFYNSDETDPVATGLLSSYATLVYVGSLGNWTADKTNYVSLTALDNASIIRTNNASWIAQIVGNYSAQAADLINTSKFDNLTIIRSHNGSWLVNNVGNWSLDKPNYLTLVALDNNSIIRNNNTTWVANAVQNSTIIRIGDSNKTLVYCGNITGAVSNLCTITGGTGGMVNGSDAYFNNFNLTGRVNISNYVFVNNLADLQYFAQREGYHVKVAPGTYNVTSTIFQQKNTVIEGSGNATVFIANHNLNAPVFSSNGRVFSTVIKSLYIDGRSETQSGNADCLRYDGYYLSFQDLWVDNCKSNGLYLNGSGGSTYVINSRFSGQNVSVLVGDQDDSYFEHVVFARNAYGLYTTGTALMCNHCDFWNSTVANAYVTTTAQFTSSRFDDSPIGAIVNGSANNVFGIWDGVRFVDTQVSNKIYNTTFWVITGTPYTAIVTIDGLVNEGDSKDITISGDGTVRYYVRGTRTWLSPNIEGTVTVHANSTMMQPLWISNVSADAVKGMIYLDGGANTATGKPTFRYYTGSFWYDLDTDTDTNSGGTGTSNVSNIFSSDKSLITFQNSSHFNTTINGTWLVLVLGNWSLDKPSYVSLTALDNGSIIRNNNLSWVANAVQNTTIARIGTCGENSSHYAVVQNTTTSGVSCVWVPKISGAGSSYTAGYGLSLTGTQFNISATTCTSGNVTRWNGTHFNCVNPIGLTCVQTGGGDILRTPLVGGSLPGKKSSTVFSDYQLTVDALFASGNVTRYDSCDSGLQSGTCLYVPWMGSSTACGESTLKEGDGNWNTQFPGASATFSNGYEVVSDEQSEVAYVIAVDNDADRMDAMYNTINMSRNTSNWLPIWLWSFNESNNLFRSLAGNNDSAIDATARYILALYAASLNTNFTTSNRTKYRTLADNMSHQSFKYEFKKINHAIPVGDGEIVYWAGAGANDVATASSNGNGLEFYTGYVPDVMRAMFAACEQMNNQTFCDIGVDVWEQYMWAFNITGLSDSYLGGYKQYRWEGNTTLGDISCLSNGGSCATPSTSYGWDDADAPRMLELSKALYHANLTFNGSYPVGITNLSNYLRAWADRSDPGKGQLYNDTHTAIQYYLNGSASTRTTGFYENGLGAGQHFWYNLTGLWTKTNESMTHLNTDVHGNYVWDSQSCYGVYRGVRVTRNLLDGMGLMDNVFFNSTGSSSETCTLNDVQFGGINISNYANISSQIFLTPANVSILEQVVKIPHTKVFLSPGTFYLSSSLNFTNNVSVVGSGDSTVLRAPNSLNSHVVQSWGRISGTTIRDLVIDGNNASNTLGDCIRFDGFYQNFEGLVLQNCAENGINFNSTGVGNNVKRARIYSENIGIKIADGNNDLYLERVSLANGNYGVYSDGDGLNSFYLDFFNHAIANAYFSKTAHLSQARFDQAPIAVILNSTANNVWSIWEGWKCTDCDMSNLITNTSFWVITESPNTAVFTVDGFVNNGDVRDLIVSGNGTTRYSIRSTRTVFNTSIESGVTVHSSSYIMQPFWITNSTPTCAKGTIYIDGGLNTGTGKPSWRYCTGTAFVDLDTDAVGVGGGGIVTVRANDTWLIVDNGTTSNFTVNTTRLVESIGNWSADKTSYSTINYVSTIGNWTADKGNYNTTAQNHVLFYNKTYALPDSNISSASAWNAKAGAGNCVGENTSHYSVTQNTTSGGVQCVWVAKYPGSGGSGDGTGGWSNTTGNTWSNNNVTVNNSGGDVWIGINSSGQPELRISRGGNPPYKFLLDESNKLIIRTPAGADLISIDNSAETYTATNLRVLPKSNSATSAIISGTSGQSNPILQIRDYSGSGTLLWDFGINKTNITTDANFTKNVTVSGNGIINFSKSGNITFYTNGCRQESNTSGVFMIC